MFRMRRGLVNGIAWVLSTGAAVTLTWWGVHTVMSGTAYDPPRALPIVDVEQAEHENAGPRPSATHRPRQSPTPGPSASDGGEAATRTKPPTGGAGSTAPTSAPPTAGRSTGGSGNVKGYTVDGGRVVFNIKQDHAELVSAVPDSGWRMQTWKHPQWIRVSFTKDSREISVFCSWYQHAPLVEIEEGS
ncbi:hypothetical protein ACFYW1_00465 [Streptomyces sp. NPDC002669]|uniref:hypothetical protein n=1 Tax=Streptomyces sp. NPDC002669 TaxID=3364658 RepID=UPI00369D788B